MKEEGSRKRPLRCPAAAGSSLVWPLATQNGFLYEAGSCAKGSISGADSLQREAERSVSNFNSRLAGLAALPQCLSVSGDGWMVSGSAPLPAGSSCLVGFPLEQLSVSVSLGKPQQR